MKTRKTTRVTFSDGGIDFTLPTRWTELSQCELMKVYDIMLVADSDSIALMVFRSLTGMSALKRTEGGRFECRFRSGSASRKAVLTASLMLSVLEPLQFLQGPGDEPVRIASVKGRRAVDACLHGVSFEKYIALENYYQGFLMSGDKEAVVAMANILYEGKPFRRLGERDSLSVVNWAVQVKNMFSRQFPNFFRPASQSEEPPSMLEVMNNEIRALTGGDIDKEHVVLACDCWRALTELDFKAKEAEEFRRRTSKTQ